MTDAKEAILEQLPMLRQYLDRSLSPHVKSRYPVDDIVNDTMVRALENLETFQFRSQASLVAWLQRIASRLVIDNIRRKQNNHVNGAEGSRIYKALTQSGELTPSRECSAQEAAHIVVAAMWKLADHHRQVIHLRYVDGLAFAAIGETMGRSPEAIRGLHRNALRELRQELGEHLCTSRSEEASFRCARGGFLKRLNPIEFPALECPMNTNRRLGDYELLEVLGRGNFGTVWEARHLKLDRLSAVKVLDRLQPNEKDNGRFFREARIAGALCHANIIRVLEFVDSDVESDQPCYLVYELIEGVTLTEWTSYTKLGHHEIAELTRKLAAALQYAHDQGVVHRDVKPENILVDLSGEPRIADFGLARKVDDRVTEHNVTLGTVAYMSPEQARGESGEADGRSDVYSLGVILFELLTGQLPFTGKTIPSYLAQVSGSEPSRPQSVNPSVPKDLGTICLKCLDQRPDDRYQSAGALADDLQRFIDGRAIHARRTGPIERGYRWCLRRPAAATLVAILTILAVFGPLLAIRQSKLRLKAQEYADSLRVAKFEKDLQDAYEAWNKGHMRQARMYLDRSQDEDGIRLRDYAWHFLDDRLNESYQVIANSNSPIYATTLTGDAKHLLTVGASDQISILNLADSRLERTLPLPHYEYWAIATLPEKNTIVVGDIHSGHSVLRFIDFASGRQLKTIDLTTDHVVSSIRLSPDGNTFTVGARYEAVRIFKPSGELIAEIPNHGRNDSVTYSPDGRWIVCAWKVRIDESNETGGIRILNARTGTVKAEKELPYSPVALAWSADSDLLTVLRKNEPIDIFTLPKLKRITNQWTSSAGNRHVDFYPGRRSLAIAREDGGVSVHSIDYNNGGGVNYATYYPHDSPVRSLSYVPGGKLMTASEDGTVVESRPDQFLSDGTHVIARIKQESIVKVLPESNRLLVVDRNGNLMDADGKVLKKLDTGITAVALSTDGKSIVCALHDGRLVTLDASDYSLRSTIKRPESPTGSLGSVLAMQLNTDRTVVICSEEHNSEDDFIQLLDANSGQQYCGHVSTNVGDVVIHDGLDLAFVKASTEEIVAFDLKKRAIAFHIYVNGASDLLTHPTKPLLITAHDDQGIRVWNIRSKHSAEQLANLRGHQGMVFAMALHPDGKTLASADGDGFIRFWNLEQLEQIGVAARCGRDRHIHNLEFSGDGTKLIALVHNHRNKASDLSDTIVQVGGEHQPVSGYLLHPRQMDIRNNVTCEIVKDGAAEFLAVQNSGSEFGQIGAWLSERCKGHEVRAHFHVDIKKGKATTFIDHYAYFDSLHRGKPTPWAGRSKQYGPGDDLTISTDWVRITHGDWTALQDGERYPYGAVLQMNKGSADIRIHSIQIDARELTR